MKYFLFFIILLALCKVSYAEFTQFDFSLGRYLVDNDKEIIVNFDYLLSGYEDKDFLVRPVIENGIVEIFNAGNNSWVSSFDLISDFPILKKEMIIKISGLYVEKSSLIFEIYNTKSGENYTTPAKGVWSGKVYSKYLDKLNAGLSKNLVLKEEVVFKPVEYLESTLVGESEEKWDLWSKLDSVPKTYFLILSTMSFLVFFLLGLKFKIRQKKKSKILDIESRVYGVSGKIQ